ncbi:WhiB family transcriptional regulator [Streptomyces sp. NPDC051561]|uniref:WhiB family transcriptional regulator n=1 Tax=Streptomyces sp. NPDC051561 TaxID=3365658 RepID=UPI0037A09D6A
MRNSIVRTPYNGAATTDVIERPRPACENEDPELFFPIGETGPALMWEDEAKTVCRRCPLMESCLDGALERNEQYGVFGGLSARERRSFKRRLARRSAA